MTSDKEKEFHAKGAKRQRTQRNISRRDGKKQKLVIEFSNRRKKYISQRRKAVTSDKEKEFHAKTRRGKDHKEIFLAETRRRREKLESKNKKEFHAKGAKRQRRKEEKDAKKKKTQRNISCPQRRRQETQRVLSI